MGGSFDSSKGEFRLCGITAGVGGYSYMNYLKVPGKIDELCVILQEKQKTARTFREQYELSFNAHLNLATIHPWVDGNGRIARLLMNYIQFCYHLFPTKIFKEDREAYILSLRQCQDEGTNQPFLDFMAGQLKNPFLWRLSDSMLHKREGSVLCSDTILKQEKTRTAIYKFRVNLHLGKFNSSKLRSEHFAVIL